MKPAATAAAAAATSGSQSAARGNFIDNSGNLLYIYKLCVAIEIQFCTQLRQTRSFIFFGYTNTHGVNHLRNPCKVVWEVGG